MDAEPTERNKWLTANDLLETDQSEKIFTPEDQFQLYSIMVRKIDFVTGERLLQSFPYVVLEETWIEKIRKKTLFLAEKTHHYFRGTKADFSIRSWQKRIIKYLEEQKRLPFPLFRLAETWQEFFLGRQSISFQSARGEGFQLSLYLSEELAYLTGVTMGDGHQFIGRLEPKAHRKDKVLEIKSLYFEDWFTPAEDNFVRLALGIQKFAAFHRCDIITFGDNFPKKYSKQLKDHLD